MKTEHVKLETVALWLNDKPGRSCGAQFVTGYFDVRLVDSGVSYYGCGLTLEGAFADAWSKIQALHKTQPLHSFGAHSI